MNNCFSPPHPLSRSNFIHREYKKEGEARKPTLEVDIEKANMIKTIFSTLHFACSFRNAFRFSLFFRWFVFVFPLWNDFESSNICTRAALSKAPRFDFMPALRELRHVWSSWWLMRWNLTPFDEGSSRPPSPVKLPLDSAKVNLSRRHFASHPTCPRTSTFSFNSGDY